jgi:ATP-binding cassette subfamily B protein
MIILCFNKQYETFWEKEESHFRSKQSVSIARAIIKILYFTFDDCLSAVDTETEETILNNLFEICKDKTTIIVSIRVSSAKMLIKLLS